MQTITFIALLLVATQTTLLAEQPPQVEVVQNSPVEHVHHQHQASSQSSPSSSVVVVGNAAPVPVGSVAPGQPQPSVVVSEVVQGPNGLEHHQHHEHVVGHIVEHPHQYSNGPMPPMVQQYQYNNNNNNQQQQVSGANPNYYSPQQAGLITVVGNGQQQQQQQNVVGNEQVKPKHYANSLLVPPQAIEQYGQPESASIPANYKPFGSWGLYIGGNPADGYYTNYYKSLGVVEKQQVGGGGGGGSGSSFQPSEMGAKPSVSASQQFVSSPLLRQASGSPYIVSGGGGGGSGGASSSEVVYPVDHGYYTPADLNSGSTSRFVAPIQAGSQVYGTPSASYEPGSSLLSYADSYATKRLGHSGGSSSSSHPLSNVQQQQIVQQQQQKGYQARTGYANYASPIMASHFGVQQASVMPSQQQQQQVVAYPVPVGSQIVGSQPGVDGAFQPFGVHAFTRYAVKPTVVGEQQQQQQYYYPSVGSPASYKQVGVAPPHYFYGYPLSQLHYSNSVSPASSIVHHSSSPSSSSSSSSPSSSNSGVVHHQSMGSPNGGEAATGPQIGHHSPMGLISAQQVGFVEQNGGNGMFVAAASDKSEVVVQDKQAQQQQQQPSHSQVDKHTHQVDKQQKRA